jgi:ubiquinone/menaquinone biosynthesis C-methylase UbiE
MALPFPNDTFDAAVMPLVIFFVPDPVKGVAEMARVVCPGGSVTAYAWDMFGSILFRSVPSWPYTGLGLMAAWAALSMGLSWATIFIIDYAWSRTR